MDILVIMNRNFHGLYTPILETLEAKGHQTTLVELGEVSKFRYKNKLQRLRNFFSRTFLRRNLKQEWREATIETFLKELATQRQSNPFDLVVINHPDICNEQHLHILKKMSHILSCHLWDSSGKEPKFFKHIDQYDSAICFDPDDVKKYGLLETSNYLRDDIHPLPVPEKYQYDVFSVLSYDQKRYHFIERFLDANPALNCNIIIYIQSEHRRKIVTHPRVRVIDQPLMGEGLIAAIKNSKSILDIGHSKQYGLSFRVFEALGYQRKLITTNALVKEYPLFSEQNIYCIDDKNLSIDPEFFESDVAAIDKKIIDSYRLDSWVDDYLEKLTRGTLKPTINGSIQASKITKSSLSRKILSATPTPFKRILIGMDPLLDETKERFTPVRIDKLKVTAKLKRSILSKRAYNSDYSIERDKKLAVVIPYRNRTKHLAKLIPALTKQLIIQGITFRIIVAEQADEKLFNRGKSNNVGALEEWEWADYFCFHDVDNIPLNAEYGCPSEPTRLVSRWDNTWRTYDMLEVTSFGGVVSIDKHALTKANGFNNEYWGWGMEDDDFLIRCLLAGSTPHQDTRGLYSDMNNPTSELAAANDWIRHSNKRWLRWQMVRKRFNEIGLNNIDYTIIDDQQCDGYRKVSYKN